MRIREVIGACLLMTWLVLANEPAQADVFRCTDREGKVSYQSQPCLEAHETRRLELAHSDAVPSAPARQPTYRRPISNRHTGSASNGWGIFTLDGSIDVPAPSAPEPAPAPRITPQRVTGPQPPVLRDKR